MVLATLRARQVNLYEIGRAGTEAIAAETRAGVPRVNLRPCALNGVERPDVVSMSDRCVIVACEKED